MEQKEYRYKVYINTTERFNKSIEIVKNSTSIIVEKVSGDINIIPILAILLKKHKIAVSDIEIIPNTGPGSFTGIKIGITIANVFSWATDNITRYKPNYGKEPNIEKRKML